MKEVLIVEPNTGEFISIDEWKKVKKPTSAELIAVPLESGDTLIIKKAPINGTYKFNEAQEAASQYKPETSQYTGFRCPTRKECIDLYDARFKCRLDEALDLIGGHFEDGYWTCETDANSEIGVGYAWYFTGYYGDMVSDGFDSWGRVQPVFRLKG